MQQYDLTDEDRAFIAQFELMPVASLDKAIGWDGYVDKSGRFYKTKPTGVTQWNGSANLHRDFAEAYYLAKGIPEHAIPKKIQGFEHEIYNAEDYLIHNEGWVSCNFDMGNEIYILPPRFDVTRMTKAQKDTIFKLFQLNGYPIEKYYKECEPELEPISDNEIPNIVC